MIQTRRERVKWYNLQKKFECNILVKNMWNIIWSKTKRKKNTATLINTLYWRMKKPIKTIMWWKICSKSCHSTHTEKIYHEISFNHSIYKKQGNKSEQINRTKVLPPDSRYYSQIFNAIPKWTFLFLVILTEIRARIKWMHQMNRIWWPVQYDRVYRIYNRVEDIFEKKEREKKN